MNWYVAVREAAIVMLTALVTWWCAAREYTIRAEMLADLAAADPQAWKNRRVERKGGR